MRMTIEQKVQRALQLMIDDGEWPSPAHEDGPRATRAAAMQTAIRLLGEALQALARTVAARAED